MSTIQDYLYGILHSVYGRTMRQYIHDGIQKCYEDATAGITPEINVSNITNGHRVTITVGDNVQTFDLENGQNGQKGEDVQNGQKGEDGQNGQKGEDGQNGKDGVGSLPDGTYTEQDIHVSGTLTSNGTWVVFFIPFINAVNRTITITSTKISVRDGGNYLANALTTGVTYEYVQEATGIKIGATKSDGSAWGGQNNSVVSVQFVFDLTVG